MNIGQDCQNKQHNKFLSELEPIAKFGGLSAPRRTEYSGFSPGLELYYYAAAILPYRYNSTVRHVYLFVVFSLKALWKSIHGARLVEGWVVFFSAEELAPHSSTAQSRAVHLTVFIKKKSDRRRIFWSPVSTHESKCLRKRLFSENSLDSNCEERIKNKYENEKVQMLRNFQLFSPLIMKF